MMRPMCLDKHVTCKDSCVEWFFLFTFMQDLVTELSHPGSWGSDKHFVVLSHPTGPPFTTEKTAFSLRVVKHLPSMHVAPGPIPSNTHTAFVLDNISSVKIKQIKIQAG